MDATSDLTLDPSLLEADCSRCAALCCVSLAFDRSALFAFDKPAGTCCVHLDGAYRCAVHHERERRGLVGCERYDCLGAGQRVTRELFAGRSWRDDPETARAMFDAFRALRQVHELFSLLSAAAALRLDPEQERRRRELIAQLQPREGWSHARLAEFERSALTDDVQRFLSTLRAAARELRRRRLRVIDADLSVAH